MALCVALTQVQSQSLAPSGFIASSVRAEEITLFYQSRAESTAAAVEAKSTNSVSQSPVPPQPTRSSGVVSDLPKWKSLLGRLQWGTLRAIVTTPYNYDKMTKVQAEVLGQLPKLITLPDPDDPNPPTRDLLVRSRTGTGKTLAFLVPAVEARLAAINRAAKQALIDAGLKSDEELEGRARRAFVRQHAGALIISPTRELAIHIADEAIKLTRHLPGLEVRLFVGGMSKRQQMREWMRDRRDIVVGTPGRLRDVLHCEPEVARGLANTPLLILDDADSLINPEFREDIEYIKKFLPSSPERQTFLFSATVSPAVRQMSKSFLSDNHAIINCVSGSDPSPVHAHIPQYHTVLPTAAHQIPSVLRLLAHDQLTNPGSSKAIIFFPTTKMTVMFANILRDVARQCLPAVRNVRVYELHSKRAQDARTRTSDAFRADTSGASILVTSDVSARGVEYPGVTRVIQVGMPAGTEQYIHRMGHAGRTNGRSDLVLLPWEVSFVTWQLSKVSLKPLTVSKLKAEVTELAAKHDANPRAYVHGLDIFRRFFPTRLVPILATVDRTVSDLLAKMDPRDIEQTFASLLGFYAENARELRVRKSEILEGCKDWAIDAMGLPYPPHINPTMLDRLGFRNRDDSGSSSRYNSRDSSGSPRSSSSSYSRPPPSTYSRPVWEDRGHVRNSQGGDSSIVASPVISTRTPVTIKIVGVPVAMTKTITEAIAVLAEARAHGEVGKLDTRSEDLQGPPVPILRYTDLCDRNP
ncbi:DEAD-domain-containing protein [Pleurotus eryngii]|uniref:ATP-dependent RNA helicase n=1 Tax=Pleurotus eryngii TaxID=5323 RepID=A0A9P5ZZZ5_PLEER|nr:DEAD-domain-containing protein [Pleurotus eryngii]